MLLPQKTGPKAGFSRTYVQQPKLSVHTLPYSRDTLTETNTHSAHTVLTVVLFQNVDQRG